MLTTEVKRLHCNQGICIHNLDTSGPGDTSGCRFAEWFSVHAAMAAMATMLEETCTTETYFSRSSSASMDHSMKGFRKK